MNQILLLNLFKRRVGDIGGMRRSFVELIAKRGYENDAAGLIKGGNNSQRIIITFRGDENHFEDLKGWDSFLLNELRLITRRKWLRLVESIGEVPIAVNVRAGNDFREAKSETDYFTKGAIKTPISWFVSSLRVVREALGYDAKTFIVSDGTNDYLKDLLEMPNVIFVRPGCAISDLLTLSKAKVLIASGGSSFSAWASFFGQMPTISHPGQSLTWFKLNNKYGYYVGEFDPAIPNKHFIESVRESL